MLVLDAKRRLPLLCIGGAAAIALTAVLFAPSSHRDVRSAPAPPLRLATLDGRTFDLARERGVVVALDFFASWCEPCNREAPTLQALSRRERGRVLVVGVDESEGRREAAGFVQAHAVTYPVALDPDGAVGAAYGVLGLPTLVVVDPRGKIAVAVPGVIDDARLRSTIAAVR